MKAIRLDGQMLCQTCKTELEGVVCLRCGQEYAPKDERCTGGFPDFQSNQNDKKELSGLWKKKKRCPDCGRTDCKPFRRKREEARRLNYLLWSRIY